MAKVWMREHVLGMVMTGEWSPGRDVDASYVAHAASSQSPEKLEIAAEVIWARRFFSATRGSR